ncbi:MAG: hypothetical protein PUF97_02990 [Bifidobacteriaceae bacterium]|nr:hypothetical protein [Bifidobacteriaceae bacterium]
MTNDIPETTPLPHDGDNDPTMPLPRTDAPTEPLPTGAGDAPTEPLPADTGDGGTVDYELAEFIADGADGSVADGGTSDRETADDDPAAAAMPNEDAAEGRQDNGVEGTNADDTVTGTTPVGDGPSAPNGPIPGGPAMPNDAQAGTGFAASGPQAAYGFGAPSPQTAQAAADQRAAAAEYAREAAANGYPGGLSAAKGPSVWTIVAGIAICMAIVLGLFLYNVDSIDIVFDPTVWLWVAMILVFGVGILLIVWTIAKEISKSRNAKDRTK